MSNAPQVWRLCYSGSKVPSLVAREYCADQSPVIFEINIARDVKRLVDLVEKASKLENKDLRFCVAVQSRPLPTTSFGVLQIFYTVEVEVPIKSGPVLSFREPRPRPQSPSPDTPEVGAVISQIRRDHHLPHPPDGGLLVADISRGRRGAKCQRIKAVSGVAFSVPARAKGARGWCLGASIWG